MKRHDQPEPRDSLRAASPLIKGGPQGGRTQKRHENVPSLPVGDTDTILRRPEGVRSLPGTKSLERIPSKTPPSPRGQTSRPGREGPRVGVRAFSVSCCQFPVSSREGRGEGRIQPIAAATHGLFPLAPVPCLNGPGGPAERTVNCALIHITRAEVINGSIERG